ncbi:MAG TPA: recombinase XerD, partial [Rhodobiaceae bacterium]|nr:recombinase XerD [Rhodobiaceae bacterium]
MAKESQERGQYLEAFLEMLSAERGAARNTLDAYERDLKDFSAFLNARSKSETAAATKDIRDYLENLAAQGLSASTAARRLSAIRQFHGFLFAEGIRS